MMLCDAGAAGAFHHLVGFFTARLDFHFLFIVPACGGVRVDKSSEGLASFIFAAFPSFRIRRGSIPCGAFAIAVAGREYCRGINATAVCES